jgi:hypothetical protein
MRRLVLAAVVLLAAPATAAADRSFTACDATLDVARVACEAAPAARDAEGLRAEGWTPIAARERDGGIAEVMAVRGTAVVRVRSAGEVPDVLAVVAGRELILSGRRLVGGQPVPEDTAVCTIAFPVRVGSITRALSAGHCAADEETGAIERRFTALRRPPQPGVVLGTIRRSLFVRTSLDALLLRVPSGEGRGAAPFVWRGFSRPPWAVVGAARSLPGRDMAFTGRTSGVDRRGEVAGAAGAAAARVLRRVAGARVVCTTARARQGDSGGPVYTAPSARGTVRALGTSTLVIGSRARLCYTPIAPVLDAFDARLVVA